MGIAGTSSAITRSLRGPTVHTRETILSSFDTVSEELSVTEEDELRNVHKLCSLPNITS
jgi:hypothetical protein